MSTLKGLLEGEVLNVALLHESLLANSSSPSTDLEACVHSLLSRAPPRGLWRAVAVAVKCLGATKALGCMRLALQIYGGKSSEAVKIAALGMYGAMFRQMGRDAGGEE